ALRQLAATLFPCTTLFRSEGAGKGSNAAGDGAGAPATRVAAGSAQVKRKADAVQEFFSIGEVCALTGLKPHVLRYWESQLRVLRDRKSTRLNSSHVKTSYA